MTKTNKIIASVVVLALVIIGVKYAVTQNDSGTDKIFTIGVIAPLTGDYSAIGENVVKGIKTAESVYEQKTGKKVIIIAEDDGADAAKGLSAYKKLTQSDHINGLINTFTSTMDSIYAPAKAAGYPVMMEAFQANNVADDYVFQMTPGNDAVWPKYADYIKNSDYDLSNFVLVHSQDAAQDSFAKSFATIYGRKTTSYTTSSHKNDLRVDAAKIIAMKPTTILFFMTPENGAILTKETLPILSSSTRLIYDIQLVTGTSVYQKILGDLSKINGAITLSPEGEKNQEFIDAYHKLYPNENPGFLADFGYDTYMVYMKSYDKNDSKWIANLKTTNTIGASGQIKFDENGIRLPDLVIKKVIGGQLENVTRLKF